jgi:hypothetical protein
MNGAAGRYGSWMLYDVVYLILRLEKVLRAAEQGEEGIYSCHEPV